MLLERSKQIASLRREFPKLSSKGILSTRYHLPIGSVFGSSECILEIHVPLTYPNKDVEIKLINPIPHMWANRDGTIRCPEWLRGTSLLCIIETVLSQFRDYVGFANQAKKEVNLSHLDSLRTSDPHDAASLEERVREVCCNPPSVAFPALIEADDDDVEQLLSNEDERLMLLHRHQKLSRLLSDLARLVRFNESMALSIISCANKKHKLLESVKEKMKLVESVRVNAKDMQDVKRKYQDAYKAQLDDRIGDLQQQITTMVEAIRNSEARFEACYDQLTSLYRTCNQLSTIRLALFG